jgi:hypothetical protein
VIAGRPPVEIVDAPARSALPFAVQMTDAAARTPFSRPACAAVVIVIAT